MSEEKRVAVRGQNARGDIVEMTSRVSRGEVINEY